MTRQLRIHVEASKRKFDIFIIRIRLILTMIGAHRKGTATHFKSILSDITFQNLLCINSQILEGINTNQHMPDICLKQKKDSINKIIPRMIKNNSFLLLNA